MADPPPLGVDPVPVDALAPLPPADAAGAIVAYAPADPAPPLQLAKDFRWASIDFDAHSQRFTVSHKLLQRREYLVGRWEVLDDDGFAVLSCIDNDGPWEYNNMFPTGRVGP